MNEICQSPCLWIGDHLDYCRAPRDVPEVLGDAHWTWVPQDAQWAILIKLVGHTVVYVPKTDGVHFVAPAFALANACAPNTVLLCQCMRDTKPALGPPRLLVVDLLCDGGKSTASLSARGRYARLRELESVLAPGAVALQWCGEREALDGNFLGSLPHPVQALVAVGEAPGEICVREV